MTLTVTLENASELGVRTTREDGLSKGLLDYLGIIDDDDSLGAKVDLIYGTILGRKTGQRQVKVLADEGQKAEDGNAKRSGRQGQRARPGEEQFHEEEDEKGDEKDAEE